MLIARDGDSETAIALAQQAGDWQLAASLVRRHAGPMIERGCYVTVQRWLAALPARMIRADPWLLFWQGTSVMPFDPERARASLAQSFTQFEKRNDLRALWLTWCSIAETFVFHWSDFHESDPWIAALEHLNARQPHLIDSDLRGRLLADMVNLFMFRQPYNPRLAEWVDELYAMARAAREPAKRFMLSGPVSLYDAWCGNVGRQQLLREDLARLRKAGTVSATTWMLFRGLMDAVCSWQTLNWQRCREAIEEAVRVSRSSGVVVFPSRILAQGAYMAASRGDIRGAQSYLEEMKAALIPTLRLDVGHYAYLAGWVAFLRGDIAQAYEHARAGYQSSTDLGTPFPQSLNAYAMAEISFARGEAKQARSFLAEARAIGAAMPSAMVLFACDCLESHFLLEEDEREAALVRLEAALRTGREHGLLNYAWWRPPLMTRLCVEALRAGIEVPYARELVRRRELVPVDTPLEIEDWPWPVRIYMLGRFAILRDAVVVEFRGKAQRKPLELLKALVLFGGRRIAVARVMDALWPDLEADGARHALESTIYRLRKLLGAEHVAVQEGRLSLNSSTVWVDHWALQRHLGVLDAAVRARDEAGAEQAFAAAARLYRGEVLADADDAWVLVPRERIRSAFIDRALQFGRYQERLGRWESALHAYQRALDVDKLTEEIHRRVMVCLLRLERRAEGLVAYRRCRDVLAREFRIEPSKLTQSIARELRGGH